MLIIPLPALVFAWLCATFAVALVIANLMGALLFTLPLPFGFPSVTLSAGIIAFPITFLLTDLINEFYGSKGAKQVTAIGFGLSVMAFFVLWLGQHLPISPNTVLSKMAYWQVSTQYTGMFLASLSAYLIGQLLDISLFGWFKQWTGSRLIWLRATGSTLVSQLFDSLIVGLLAFWGDLPLSVILGICTANYWVKFGSAILTTPVLYVAHALLNRFLKPSTPFPQEED
jgi:queuosine precursor transporter